MDGDHIRGLLIDLFYHFWPELLENGFLYDFVTPIVQADDIEFLSMYDYD